MITVTQQHIDMMAETMFAAYYARVPGVSWANESDEQEREDWRRAARATFRLLESMPLEIRVK